MDTNVEHKAKFEQNDFFPTSLKFISTKFAKVHQRLERCFQVKNSMCDGRLDELLRIYVHCKQGN